MVRRLGAWLPPTRRPPTGKEPSRVRVGRAATAVPTEKKAVWVWPFTQQCGLVKQLQLEPQAHGGAPTLPSSSSPPRTSAALPGRVGDGEAGGGP